jgi:hypothetical protein
MFGATERLAVLINLPQRFSLEAVLKQLVHLLCGKERLIGIVRPIISDAE